MRAAANALAGGGEDYAAAAKLMVTVPLGWDHPLPRTAQLEVDGRRRRRPAVLPPKPLSGAAYLCAHRPRLQWVGDAAGLVHVRRSRRREARGVAPTLKALAERLGHLRQLGVGVALWGSATASTTTI